MIMWIPQQMSCGSLTIMEIQHAHAAACARAPRVNPRTVLTDITRHFSQGHRLSRGAKDPATAALASLLTAGASMRRSGAAGDAQVVAGRVAEAEVG